MSDLDTRIAEAGADLRSKSSDLAQTLASAFKEAVKNRIPDDPKLAANLLFDFVELFDAAVSGMAFGGIMASLGGNEKALEASYVSVELLKEISTGLLLATGELCGEFPEPETGEVIDPSLTTALNILTKVFGTSDSDDTAHNASECEVCAAMAPQDGTPNPLEYLFAQGAAEGN